MSKQVLIVGPSWVGDMVMAQALFKLIKQQDPSTHIDVIAPAWSIDILQRMPEVRNRICIPIAHGEFGLIKRIKLAYRLSKVRYDQAIVLTNTWKSALIPWLADIPVRTGWFGEMRWFLLNDRRHLNKERFPKMVQRYAALIYPKSKHPPKNIPAPHLTTDPAAVAAVVQKFGLNLNQPILALCPGAAYGPAKRWPEAYFAHIAQEKIAAGWQVWLFGSQQDEPVIEKIRADINSLTTSFAGKINLLETVDLLSLATSVVTNDSGLLHIAASLDKPLVAIYGSTSPVFTPPLGDKSHVLSENLACSPCFKRVCPLKHFNCMHQIKPEKVLAALDNLENK